MKIKYSKEVSDFIEGTSNCIPVSYPLQDTSYYYMPFWFKKVGECMFEIYNLDELPQELKNEIKKNRELKTI